LSSFSAAAAERTALAFTDASNSEARAEAEEAAAEADARAEAIAADAEDARTEGGVPEKAAVFGVVGVLGAEGLLPPWVHPVSTTAVRVQANATNGRGNERSV
jgi:regulator of protease activity HflC (stomatin/prohibitin superfamily)